MDSGTEVNEPNTSARVQILTHGNESSSDFSLQPWFAHRKPNKQEEPTLQDPSLKCKWQQFCMSRKGALIWVKMSG